MIEELLFLVIAAQEGITLVQLPVRQETRHQHINPQPRGKKLKARAPTADGQGKHEAAGSIKITCWCYYTVPWDRSQLLLF